MSEANSWKDAAAAAVAQRLRDLCPLLLEVSVAQDFYRVEWQTTPAAVVTTGLNKLVAHRVYNQKVQETRTLSLIVTVLVGGGGGGDEALTGAGGANDTGQQAFKALNGFQPNINAAHPDITSIEPMGMAGEEPFELDTGEQGLEQEWILPVNMVSGVMS